MPVRDEWVPGVGFRTVEIDVGDGEGEHHSAGLKRYDAGLLGDGGGGDVYWWQNYMRAELARAHEFYADQFADSQESEIGKVFDLAGIKRLWRTGVETGSILRDAEHNPRQAFKAGAEAMQRALADALRDHLNSRAAAIANNIDLPEYRP